MKPICVTAQIFARAAWRDKIANQYVVADSGCWEWTGPMDRYGYGTVKAPLGGRRRSTGAHRASWVAHRGPILGDLHIDHLCRNRKCINPFHLEPVTAEENARRGAPFESVKPTGRPRVPLEKRKKCAKHGEDNGRFVKNSGGYTAWVCRLCQADRMRRWKERQAG